VCPSPLAVQRRRDSDGDFIAGAERIRPGFSDPVSSEAGGAAADDRPLGSRAIRVFDVESQRRVTHLRFLSQCVHASKSE